jgi:hypothetical protein
VPFDDPFDEGIDILACLSRENSLYARAFDQGYFSS